MSLPRMLLLLAPAFAGAVACEPDSAQHPSLASAVTPAERPAPFGGSEEASESTGSGTSCRDDLSRPAGADAKLADPYAETYRTFELGEVPGVPGPLGGCVVKQGDPNTLLVAGGSESIAGAIYAIKIKRGPCGHIIGWDGRAARVAEASYVDANLVYTGTGNLLYARWPKFGLGQLLPDATEPSRETELRALGVGGGGGGGLGFVPPGIATAGELRLLSWPEGFFYHLKVTASGGLLEATGATKKTELPNGPGGFAYVPAGSPGFAKQSIVASEWSTHTIATYDVDAQGDPIPKTRRPFFASFPRPWGAYFEPVTGDFLFLTWGDRTADGMDAKPDRMYLVQGFAKPPPPPMPR